VDKLREAVDLLTDKLIGRLHICSGISRLDVEEYLRLQFPQARNIVYLPQTFSTIVKAVNKKVLDAHIIMSLSYIIFQVTLATI
jgi:hypothetical protein